MKNRRHSEVSDSDESDEAPAAKKSTVTTIQKTNHHSSSSSESSDSSSEAEDKSRHKSSNLNQPVSSTSPRKTVPTNALDKFLSQNPSLSKLQVIDTITEDEDICFLEIPKNIDPELLLDKEIKFNKKTKLKLNKTKYIIEPSIEDIKPFTILTNRLQIIHPIASLQLREYIKQKPESELIEDVKFSPTLPENLKMRHPLFGAKYENKIVLDQEIQQKLDNTIDEFVKKKKKKKKKKESIEHQEESIFTLLESHSTEKKKKKKKHRQDGIESAYSSLETDTIEQEKGHSSEKKKKKHKNNSVSIEDVFEPQPDPEQSFEMKKEKHKKDDKKIKIINSTIIPGLQLPPFDFDISSIMNKEEQRDDFKSEETVKRKKKKKEQNEEETIEIDTSLYHNGGVETDEGSGMTKSKKRIKDEVGETNEGISVRKSKKKIKEEIVETNEGGIVTASKRKSKEEIDEGDIAPSPKKKRKKEKRGEEETEATNSLIFDILSRVKSEIDSPVTKTKKKKTDR